ncbi:MAG: hypothetical protein AAF616_07390 [Bacteroidota bacterium]
MIKVVSLAIEFNYSKPLQRLFTLFLMKPIATLSMLLCIVVSLAQNPASEDNISYPFQILFAEDAAYIATKEELRTYDFTKRYGLIRNKGRLVLLHYSGYLVESEPGLLDVREISKHLESDDPHIRPPISSNSAGLNAVEWQRERQYHNIQLRYPWKHTIQLSRHERLPLQWVLKKDLIRPKKPTFEITVKDLHDKVLLRETTKEQYYEVNLENLELPENLVICTISLPEVNEVSDDIVIAFEQEHQVQSVLTKHYTVTKYQSFVDGLIAVQKAEYALASKLFHIAIDTHEDPIFDQMYKSLLDIHPKLKAALE